MALGEIVDPSEVIASAKGVVGKAKKTALDRELDNFGKQILDTEAKWRLASMSTLKGLNRFISAVNKAAETVERIKGLRKEGISGPGMDPGEQRRYASLQQRRRQAETAIQSSKSEKRLGEIREKGIQDQITQQKRMDDLQTRIERRQLRYTEQRARRIAGSRRIAYGPDTGNEGQSFIMQRRGRAVPGLSDYTSSRVSGIRGPGTEIVPAGGRDIELYKQPGGLYAPQNYGPLATGGIPTAGWMGPRPNYPVGPYRGGRMPGGYGGQPPFITGGELLGPLSTVYGLAKKAYNYTSNAFEEPALEDIYRASRTSGGWNKYMRGVGAPLGGYDVSENLAHMGYTPESAAGVQNIYGSAFRSGTVRNIIGRLSTDKGATGTGNITKEQWASIFGESLKVGMLGGTTGMEQFSDAVSKGFIKASKYALPAPAVLENIETYTKMMASSSAVRTGTEMMAAAGGAAQYAAPNWKNLSVQTEALQSYDKLLGNMESNPMALLLGAGKMAGITGGRLTGTPAQLAKFGGLGKGFKFSKVQQEYINDAMKMGGVPGFLEEMDVLKMAGAKPEVLQKNVIDQLMKTGMPRSRAEFLATRILGTKFPEERGMRRAATTKAGGALPRGLTASMEARAASKFDYFNEVPGDFGAAGELAVKTSESPDVFGARRGRAASQAELIAKETAAIAAFGPATTDFKDAVSDFATAVKNFVGMGTGSSPSSFYGPPAGATVAHPAGSMSGMSPKETDIWNFFHPHDRRPGGTPSASSVAPTP